MLSTNKLLQRFPQSQRTDRKSTRLNSSHTVISYAVFCLKKKKKNRNTNTNSHVDTASTSNKHEPLRHARNAIIRPDAKLRGADTGTRVTSPNATKIDRLA